VILLQKKKKRNRLGDSTTNILLLVKNWVGQPDVEEWEREDEEEEEPDWVDEPANGQPRRTIVKLGAMYNRHSN
jgi:hypothetical protein